MSPNSAEGDRRYPDVREEASGPESEWYGARSMLLALLLGGHLSVLGLSFYHYRALLLALTASVVRRLPSVGGLFHHRLFFGSDWATAASHDGNVPVELVACLEGPPLCG